MVGVAVVLVVFLSLPRISVRLQSGWPSLSEIYLLELARAASLELGREAAPSLDELRAVLSEDLPDLPERDRRNLFLGGRIREEDSPGNYTVREREAGVEIIGYDATGNPWVIARWSTHGFELTPDQ
jgi:hypothetical protein